MPPLPAVAKQAKVLGAKLRIQQGEEEEGAGEEDDAEGAARKARLWGASKRAYYGADLADLEVSEGVVACLDEHPTGCMPALTSAQLRSARQHPAACRWGGASTERAPGCSSLPPATAARATC